MAAVAQTPASVPTAPAVSLEPPSTDIKEEPTVTSDEKAADSDKAVAGPADGKNEDGDQKRAPSSEQDGDGGAKSPNGPGADTSTRFDLEPNPFEQSFSRGPQSQDRTTPPRGGDATSIKHNALPPLSSLTSPAAADPTQFPWLAGQSLRSGPLSPAMLAGPAAQNNNQNNNQNNSNSNANQTWGPATENAATSEETFEPGNFRTGFTPGTGSGFTPGYNALLNPGFGNLPMPSPNTAAFLANITSVTNENGDQQAPSDQRQPQPPSGIHQLGGPHGMSHLNPAHQSAETITPGTLNAIASDLNRQQPPPGMAPGFYPGMQSQPGMVPGIPPADYAQQNANAASQAANGLFLLSQAHQELSKREEEAKSTPPSSKRGAPSGGSAGKSAGQKRKEPAGKGNAAKKSKKSPEIELPSDDDSDSDSRKSGGEKRSRNETEEDKRKNFLERNRQAALKCRQRKKAWLNELQNKVETLTMDNERLLHNVRGLEDEVNRLTNILMSHRECGIGMPPMPQAYGRPLR
ncbi:hypothetical protein CspHIS471_0207830 [Cutaneotrichosporon sp. HIS471]|nr:hypothetical protein CspHIS471_0207830 [Cutaneotrichosporon sp. HIS471]